MATKKNAYTVSLELFNSTSGAKWDDGDPSSYAVVLEDVDVNIYKDGILSETRNPDSIISDNLMTINLTGGDSGDTDANCLFLEPIYTGAEPVEIASVQILFSSEVLQNTSNLLVTDSNGRIEISGTKNTLDDLNDIDGSSVIVTTNNDKTGYSISGVKNTLDDLNDIDGSSVTVTSVTDKAGYSLASTGLDSISSTEPSGRATTFREMIIQTWMRFFNKVDKDSDTISVYNNSNTAITTQLYGEGETEVVYKSEDA